MTEKSARTRQAVLILGSGHGALKVANDIVHAGLPAVWATRFGQFLEFPQGIEQYGELPADLGYQFRPLYLRVKNNPLLTPLTKARVVAWERAGEGQRAVIEQDPFYIDENLCTGCGRCTEICPLNNSENSPIKRTPGYNPSRALELDKRTISPCRQNCPLGVNVQAYMALTAAGRYRDALAVIREDNPLPGVCGRVCHHPCEAACRRAELDQPLAVRDIKRFLFDYEVKQGIPTGLVMPDRPERPEAVAVVGSGPTGLAAAYFLRRQGFKVTVFESLPEPGGMLRVGINAFRLPRWVLEAEIKALVDIGIEIRTNTLIQDLNDLLGQGFKAVLLATGTHQDLFLNIPGEDLEGVGHCVDFLSKVNLTGSGSLGPRTVVIGGGNSAMDAARCALRLGAEEVTILAIETEDQMPAHPREVQEAREEGVSFCLGVAPVSFAGRDRVEGVFFRPAHWEFSSSGPPQLVFDGEDTTLLAADSVIVAIGQKPHLDRLGLQGQVETGPGLRVVVDDCGRTSRQGIFAAGDVVSGPSTVVGSMAMGRRAASYIGEQLTGRPSVCPDRTLAQRGVGEYLEITEDIPRQPRQAMAQRQPKARRRNFEEVDYGLTNDQAMIEAKRCLQCGCCSECRACEAACRDIGAIDHYRPGKRMEIITPVVIVTDGGELFNTEGLDNGLVYHLRNRDGSGDLMSVMMAGTAAAGQAMTRAAGLRGVSGSGPVERQPEIQEERYGFFLCTCNQTLAPPDTLKRIRDLAGSIPGIEVSELIFSACHPEGAAQVARLVEESRLSRVILGSCICCPLEFHCISCTDQRTRAKNLLFETLGLARSRFELVNFKDHLKDWARSEDEMVEAARELLRMAYIRSRFMGPLRLGETEIGRNILILGGSDVGVSCANNLAVQGFSVRLVHRCQLPLGDLPEKIKNRPLGIDIQPGIDQVAEAEIESLEGALGNFSVKARLKGEVVKWQADLVCLTDENVVSLALPTGRTGLRKFYRHDFAFFHSPQSGLYRVMPITLKRVSAFEAGAALAAEVCTATAEAFLSDCQLSPRVDPDRCRGCGRCEEICPFKAIRLTANGDGFFTSEVLRHNCVGCGGCVGRCPVTAMDMPYFSNQVLKELVVGALAGGR